MEILIKDRGEKGISYSVLETNILAQMTYVWTGKDKIIIYHT